jgi:hypothetical protein
MAGATDFALSLVTGVEARLRLPFRGSGFAHSTRASGESTELLKGITIASWHHTPAIKVLRQIIVSLFSALSMHQGKHFKITTSANEKKP